MRKRRAVKRDVLPDPIYNSKVVTKLVNQIMLDGKKGTAQKILYEAFDIVAEKTGKPAYGAGYTDLCHTVYYGRGCGFHAACHRQACRYRRPGCDLPETPLHG